MRYLYVLIFIISSTNLLSQNRIEKCERIYLAAESLFLKGEYSSAIKKLSAYKICSNSNENKKADALLVKIYTTVNEQKEKAITAKKEAERLTIIANQRASTIQQQRDSIQRENIANRIATQALQVNQIDPNKALNYIYAGYCHSPNNTSLHEIRRKIVTDEILFRGIKGANIFNTTSVAKLNRNTIYTADSDGEIKLWNNLTFKLEHRIKVFNSSILLCQKINDTSIIVYGNDSKDFKHPIRRIKILEISSRNTIKIVADSLKSTITSLVNSYEDSTVYFSTENGDINKLQISSLNVSRFKSIGRNVVGLQCWIDAKKIFYATSQGIFDLFSNRQYYIAPSGVPITYFGFCNTTGDFYVCFAQDLLLFNLATQKDHLLYPIHKGMITSCTCSDSLGSFLTTSLDGYGVLWTANGNISRTLKGSKAELYHGYIDPNEKFAITVGRRELNAGQTADTNTIKYWFLSHLLEDKKEAHLFGANALVVSDELRLVMTGGNSGEVKIWDEDLNLIDSQKPTEAAISTLSWDKIRKKIWYGTYDGNIGSIQLSEKGVINSFNKQLQHHKEISSIVIDPIGNVYSVDRSGILRVQNTVNKCIDSVYFKTEITNLCFSPDYKVLLLSTANKALIYDLTSRKTKLFQHSIKVNAAKWLSSSMFATVSGQFLRIWDINNNQDPVLKADNNIRNIMTSLHVDMDNKLIYTGTWTGYIFCWDFYGKQLFSLDQLTSLASTNIINSICGIRNNSHIFSVDYNGNLAKWYSPYFFIKNQLNMKFTCSD